MSTESGMVLVPRAELHSIFKAVEALKLPCGWDPEEPQAARNGVYATIARRLWDLLAATPASPPTPDPDLCDHGNHPADGCAKCAIPNEASQNDYVTFTSAGIKVDLARFLKTGEGKELLRKVELASKRFEKPCPDCGSPHRDHTTLKGQNNNEN